MKWTTKRRGFILQMAAAVFILLLMIFTLVHLAPATKSRLEDCGSRIERLEEKRVSAADDLNELAEIDADIQFYTERMGMLRGRDKIYSVSMAFLICVLVAGAVMQYIKTATFADQAESDGEDTPGGYYPYLGAPLAAVCILLAVGVSYQMILSLELMDFLMLAGAVAVGLLSFWIYRQSPYFASKISERVKLQGRFSSGELLFFLPAAGIFILLFVTLLFGKEINGARLWVSLGGVMVQPGEFVKVLMIVLFASSYGKMWRAIFSIAVGGVTTVAFLLMRDMGGAIIIIAMLFTMLFLLLDNKMTFSLFEHRKLLVITLLLTVSLFVVALTFFPYARARLGNVGSAMERGGQQAEMLKALICGGLGGLGPENSSYILNIYAVESDMAIAGITAVFGFGMLLIVLLCYAVLILIPLRKASVYRQFYFASAQVSAVLAVQVLFNALGAVDVLPFTGIVAPFLSKGGSALVSFCAMAGIVLATLHPVIKPLEVEDR